MQWNTPGSPFGSTDSDRIANAGTTLGVLGGRYRILQRKRGGMSDVYICEALDDPDLKVAFKTFREDRVFDRLTRIAFFREVAIWMRISGLPYIMPTLGIDVFNGRPFIRMPAVQGIATLRDALNLTPALPAEAVHELAFQIAYGMAAAGRHLPGLVHGDLKPENLFFKSVGRLLISDFGMSRVRGEVDASVLLDSSWPYQAPECWSDGEQRTSSSDIYAYGVVLYQMLTGSLPFRATGQSEWARVHHECEPMVPESGDAHQPLLQLSLKCLVKKPELRPESFHAVLAELDRLGGIVNATLRHYEGTHQFLEHAKVQKAVRPLLIRALVQVGELNLAVSELDTVPDELRDASYWALRGSAVALVGRHEEAVECFDRALCDSLSSKRHEWQCERALSLKRLGRSDDAIAVYHRLLLEVPDNVLPMVVNNLSTVYTERGQPNAVIRLLRPLTRHFPKHAAAWGNLGEAYRQLNQFDKAEEYMRRAIGLNPAEEGLRAHLAVSVLLRGMARVEDALALLEDGMNRGDESGRLLPGMLACYVLLNRKAEIADLVLSIRAHFSAKTMERMLKDSEALVSNVVEIARAGPKSAVAEDTSVPRDEANEALQQALNVLEGIKRANPEFPAFTLRLEGDAFSFNFYDDLDASDYVATFLRAWRAVARTFRYRIAFRQPRSNPFYFTQCPHCTTAILTNRDPHTDLQCRICQQHHRIARFDSRATVELLPKLEESLGKHRIDLSGKTVILVIQPTTEQQGVEIGTVCRQAGFTPLPEDSMDVRDLVASGFETGLLPLGSTFNAWAKVCSAGSVAYNEDTPPEIDRLLLRLRDKFRGFASLSKVAELVDVDVSMHEGAFRNLVRSDPQDAINHRALMEILLAQNRFEEALPFALSSVRSWPDEANMWSMLARVEQGREEYEAAIEHAEHALRLDPTDRRALLVLVNTHRARGDVESENAAAIRLSNLGLGLS